MTHSTSTIGRSTQSFSHSFGGSMHLARVVALAMLGVSANLAAQARRTRAAEKNDLPWPTGTFSILAYDSTTGEVGGAVQSRVFSVGNGVLWAEAGVGAAATQAIVDVSYGPQAIALLQKGLKPAEIVKTIWERDPDPDSTRWSKQGRQFAVIDAQGNVAAYTGPKATE